MDYFKTVESSRVTFSQLMLPSHSNFSGKIHGGYILSLMDQIAFACASKYTERYCVTAAVDRVDFLKPIEVGELVTLNASVNYVGQTSVLVGIRVESQNIQGGAIKHCNSSYFSMIAKDEMGINTKVPPLILKNPEEIRRFHDAIRRIEFRKLRERIADDIDCTSETFMEQLEKHYRVKIEF